MRFLANENFPGAAVTALEAAGHDVVGAIECIIDADPVAACVREIMAERSSWLMGWRTRWPPPPRADFPPGIGHRHHVQSRRPSG
jgi:hypothetical protein